MAVALTTLNAQVLYNQSGPDLFAAIALRNVSTGDTLDLGVVTDLQPAFQVIRKAVIVSVGANLAAVCAVAGTVVTIPGPGLAAAGAYLVVSGC